MIGISIPSIGIAAYILGVCVDLENQISPRDCNGNFYCYNEIFYYLRKASKFKEILHIFLKIWFLPVSLF